MLVRTTSAICSASAAESPGLSAWFSRVWKAVIVAAKSRRVSDPAMQAKLCSMEISRSAASGARHAEAFGSVVVTPSPPVPRVPPIPIGSFEFE